MEIVLYPARNDWEALCKRPSETDGDIRTRVETILERVRRDGDRALAELAEEIEGRRPYRLLMESDDFSDAAAQIDGKLGEAIRNAADNIRKFHERQMPSTIEVETAPGVKCIQKPVPIHRVGLYIPGGSAPLFSTVLMLAIPANIAGCREVILCTPAGKDGRIAPAVLFAASLCGVTKVFRTGGAQAIAAMAYGTETIPKVDKIFGPGNRYVTCAKQILASGTVAIDMPAGPSEVMVIADDTARDGFVAADLLSQAEHGPDSQVMLVCFSREKAGSIKRELEDQMERLPRKNLAEESLRGSRFIVLGGEDEAADFANMYAPEHLIISTEEPWRIAEKIYAAGSVFIGHYTPESAGDYASGTNHTLPTCGWARSFSGVNIDSFIRKMTVQEITKDGLADLSGTITEMAEAEGLQAHANAVKIRINGQE